MRNRSMCVKIARDVLFQIRKGRYMAASGIYIEILDSHGYRVDEWSDINRTQSFKTFFKENKEVKCEVCALGAAFASLVNIENKCSVEEILENENIFTRLEKYFGAKNIDLMESAFECIPMDSCNSELNEAVLVMAAEWGSRYYNEQDRLRAIMLNVIRNNGDFKIPVKMLAKAGV